MTEDEKIHLAHQTAVQMITFMGQMIWRSFSAMAAIHSLVIAIGGAFVKLNPTMQGREVIPIVGGILCACWAVLMARQFAYQSFWYDYAKSLEAKYLMPPVSPVSDCAQFSKTGFNWFQRVFTVEFLVYTVVLVFAYLYWLLYHL